MLRPGGRLAAISFHSLEDRMVKDFFKGHAAGCICPPGLPQCVCGHEPTHARAHAQAGHAARREAESNPRSKSAKLRVAVRLEEAERGHGRTARAPRAAAAAGRGGAAADARPTRTARRTRAAARRSARASCARSSSSSPASRCSPSGRVALSFAVVQKTLQTDAVVHEAAPRERQERRAQEEVAQLPPPCASATSPRPSWASWTRRTCCTCSR